MTDPRLVHIGVSTKAYLGWHASLDWITAVADLLAARPLSTSVRLFVIPSFPVLPAAIAKLATHGVQIGAQDAGWGSGALTGEVSTELLRELGVAIVEVGHAERRALFHESDEVVRRKTTAVLRSGMTPLVCVGEPARSDPDAAVRICMRQVVAAVEKTDDSSGEVMIAYEPVWAIGAEQPAEPEYVNAVINGLRVALADQFPLEHGAAGPGFPIIRTIIYGGSAGPGLLGQLPEADGLFLGRFAHDPSNLAEVLAEAARPRPAATPAGHRALHRNVTSAILHS